tara:strand:+ start:2318 stop:2560 length:243 start_codon:yes stop_codon:yes gene_type:complete
MKKIDLVDEIVDIAMSLDAGDITLDEVIDRAENLGKKHQPKQLILSGVGCCSCKIPEPRMKVSENGTSAYCVKCTKTYVQ